MADKLSRLQKLSRPFAALFTIALLLAVCVQATAVLSILLFFHDGDGWHAFANFGSTGVGLAIVGATDKASGIPLAALTTETRLWLASLTLLCAIPTTLAIFHLRQLFTLYAHGIVFGKENIRHLKHFGFWLALSALITNLGSRAFTAITNLPDVASANAAMAILQGGTIYVIARVMELGREADLERKEFL